MKTLSQPWTAATEATVFTGWIYDRLQPHAAAPKVAHPAELRSLRLCRETVVRLHKAESAVARSPKRDSLLLDRVDMFIPALGPITALTSALEVGEVQRFSSIKKAISYCGLSSAG